MVTQRMDWSCLLGYQHLLPGVITSPRLGAAKERAWALRLVTFPDQVAGQWDGVLLQKLG